MVASCQKVRHVTFDKQNRLNRLHVQNVATLGQNEKVKKTGLAGLPEPDLCDFHRFALLVSAKILDFRGFYVGIGFHTMPESLKACNARF